MTTFYQPGRYWGKITEQAIGKTSNGNPQIVLRFLVLGRINPANPEGDLLPVESQMERTFYRVITEKTIDFVMQDLETLGFSGTSFSQLDPNHESSQDLTGKELEWSCSHESYQDDMKERWHLARSGVVVQPLESKELRKLDAMFGKQLKAGASKKPNDKPQDESGRKVPEPVNETESDDIPF